MLFPPCLVDKCICIYALIQESCIKQLNKLIGLDLQTYLHEISPRHSLKPSFPDGIPRKKTQVKINAAVGEMTTNAEKDPWACLVPRSSKETTHPKDAVRSSRLTTPSLCNVGAEEGRRRAAALLLQSANGRVYLYGDGDKLGTTRIAVQAKVRLWCNFSLRLKSGP
jgi:hypothetical protein